MISPSATIGKLRRKIRENTKRTLSYTPTTLLSTQYSKITCSRRVNSSAQFHVKIHDSGIKIMNSKILLVFVGLCGLAIADNSDLFVGRWKEDQYKREGLNDYLYYRGESS